MSDNLDQVRIAIKNLHTEHFKDITGTPVCKECGQYLPCDTLKILDGKA